MSQPYGTRRRNGSFGDRLNDVEPFDHQGESRITRRRQRLRIMAGPFDGRRGDAGTTQGTRARFSRGGRVITRARSRSGSVR